MANVLITIHISRVFYDCGLLPAGNLRFIKENSHYIIVSCSLKVCCLAYIRNLFIQITKTNVVNRLCFLPSLPRCHSNCTLDMISHNKK